MSLSAASERASRGYRGLRTSFLRSAHYPGLGGCSRGGRDGAVRPRVILSLPWKKVYLLPTLEVELGQSLRQGLIKRSTPKKLPLSLKESHALFLHDLYFQHEHQVKYLEASKFRSSDRPGLLGGLRKSRGVRCGWATDYTLQLRPTVLREATRKVGRILPHN